MGSMEITGQSIRGIMVRVCGMGLLYLSTAIAAKFLGAEEFGIFSSVLSFSPIIAIIAVGGTDIFATKSVAILTRKDSTSDIASEVALTHAVGLLGVGCGLIIIAIVVTATFALGIKIGNLTVLVMSVLVFPLTVLINVRQNITLPVSGAATAMFPEQIILPTLFCGSLVVAGKLFSRGDAYFVLCDYACSALVAWIIGWFLVRKYVPVFRCLFMPLTFKEVIGRIWESRPFLVSAFSSVVMNNAVTVLVSALFGFKAAGLYFVAVRIAGLPYVPLGVIDQVIMPAAARYHVSDDRSGLTALTKLTTSLSFLGGLSIAVVIAIFHESILGFFGQEFRQAGSILLIMLAAQAINCMTGPKASLMRMIGLEKECSWCFLVISITLPILVYVVSLYAGIVAVAICASSMLVLLTLMQCWFLWVRKGVIALPYGPKDLIGIVNRVPWRQLSLLQILRRIRQVVVS